MSGPRHGVVDPEARLVAHCRRCDLALTRGAVEIAGVIDPDRVVDGADLVPAGLLFRAPPGLWIGARPGSVVVHHGDVQNTRPSGDRSGCCGPTGADGPNRSCACGHPVATEVADCWAPRFMLLEPAAVQLRPGAHDRPDARVHRFQAEAAMRNAWPFHAWLHEVLAAPDWFADDTAGLVAWWLAAHDGSLAVVFAGSVGARAAGVPVDALADAARSAQPEPRRRRFAIVLV